LIQGGDGNFYGITGGVWGTSSWPGFPGTVFQLTPSGVLTTLYQFDPYESSGPTSLIQGSDGSFYGTIGFDTGQGNDGSIFRLTVSYGPQCHQ
jgi:hypothetical protein